MLAGRSEKHEKVVRGTEGIIVGAALPAAAFLLAAFMLIPSILVVLETVEVD
jgi:hypothetical protein